ncbi:E3 ubiquitin-protein ligase PUB24-like [Henckelia pumila]|uniref:E3 ubiquitin-protein ligase PUB24-like n=1 Tax=Henckelia pumila TaxID=405737 RepID=UPI003C6DF011
MDELDIPQYFICPISLQIMKDPVTTIYGITYDRESIERWLLTAADEGHSAAVCPVTKQLLPLMNSDLTPNHMLRRLIQAWCIANAKSGIERIPTPRSPVNKSVVFKLIRDLKSGNPLLHLNAIKKLDEFAKDKEKNQKPMAEAGVPKAMIFLILKRFREGKSLFLEEALRILQLTWIPTEENKKIVEENFDLVQSLLWVLSSDHEVENISRIHALKMLKNVTEVAKTSLLERLKLGFFTEMVNILHKNKSPQDNKAVLHVLIQTSPFGRNRMKIVEAGAIFEVMELELNNPDKKTTELIFCLLANLCTCADGRQQFLKHAGGIALAAKRLLRISPTTDDRALCIMESIARFSATREVVSEMLRVSAVSKLCMVLQADCAGYLKNKARDILRLHNYAWSNSPCIQVYLLTWYTRG